MPFLLAEILDFQGSAHLIGVGSLSQELKNMVNEVNQTEVSPMDVLTGEVYFYDKEAHQLTIASERTEKAEEKNTDRPMSIMDKLNTAKERITKEPGNTRLEPGLAI